MTMDYLLPDLRPLESRHVLLYYDQRGSGRSTIVKDSARLRAVDHTATWRRSDDIFISLAPAYWGDVADAAKAKGHPCTTADWMRNFVHVNDAMLASVGAYDWRARLADVKVPVLVIHGTRDPIPLDAAREWAASFGDARLLTIEGTGHFPWVERPTTFFPAVESFLNGSWPKGAHSVPRK